MEATGEVVAIAYDRDRQIDNPWEITVGLHPWVSDSFTMRLTDAKDVRIGDPVVVKILSRANDDATHPRS